MPVNTAQLAGDLGLGDGLGRNSPIARTLNRLCQFDLAQWQNDGLCVRTAVAPLAERHLRRLSPPVLAVHQTLLRQRTANGRTHRPQAVGPTVEPVEVAASTRLGVDL